MVTSDPISDMLTRIRNAGLVKKETVSIPFSKIKEQLADVFKRVGYINSYKVQGEGKDKVIIVSLKYLNHEFAFTSLLRESKPGCRKYGSPKTTKKNYKHPQFAVRIWSTNKGLLTEQEAVKENTGGEHLCTIW